MGIETAALAILAAASTYQGYQSYESAKDTKSAMKTQERAAKTLQEQEERNRLQSIMRIQKRAGGKAFDGTLLTKSSLGNVPDRKTLLGE